MSLNYPPGGLEYALRIIGTEGPEDLTSYEKTQLAIELVKASTIHDVANGLENISDQLVEISRKISGK